MEEILHTAQEDSEQWVAVVGDMLKTFPSTGSLNNDVDEVHHFFHEVVNELRKIGELMVTFIGSFCDTFLILETQLLGMFEIILDLVKCCH